MRQAIDGTGSTGGSFASSTFDGQVFAVVQTGGNFDGVVDFHLDVVDRSVHIQVIRNRRDFRNN